MLFIFKKVILNVVSCEFLVRLSQNLKYKKKKKESMSTDRKCISGKLTCLEITYIGTFQTCMDTIYLAKFAIIAVWLIFPD